MHSFDGFSKMAAPARIPPFPIIFDRNWFTRTICEIKQVYFTPLDFSEWVTISM